MVPQTWWSLGGGGRNIPTQKVFLSLPLPPMRLTLTLLKTIILLNLPWVPQHPASPCLSALHLGSNHSSPGFSNRLFLQVFSLDTSVQTTLMSPTISFTPGKPS